MAWFLVETFASCHTNSVAPRIDGVALAAERVSEEGAEVRLSHAILVPEDETCFYLYESSSAAAVREAVRRADLAFARITEAISTRPPEARLGRCHRTDSHEQAGGRE
jgi:hypothetical protein